MSTTSELSRGSRITQFPLTWMLVGVGGVSALTASGPSVVPVVGAVAAGVLVARHGRR